MNIKNIMNKEVFSVSENVKVQEAAKIMTEKNVGSITVTDSKTNKLYGIITDRDIITRCLGKNLDPGKTSVGDIMTTNIIYVNPRNSVTESARIMAKNKIRRLPVCEHGKIVGIISLGDISRSKLMFAETASAFCDICEDSTKESNYTNQKEV